MSTMVAPLRGGVELVDLDEDTPIPLGLVLQLAYKFTPTHITNGLGEAMVLNHVLDLQALDTYDLVLAYELRRELVLVISASIGTTCMDFGHLATCLLTALGAFVLLGKPALSTGQLLLVCGEKLGVAKGVAIGGENHRFQAQVQPDHFGDNLQRGDLLFNKDRDEVATCRVEAGRHTGGFAVFGQGSRPVNVKGLFHLGEGQVHSLQLKGSANIGGGLLAMLLFEEGILRTTLKEVQKRFIEVTQSLLQGHTGDFIEPVCRDLLLEVGQLDTQVIVVEPFASLVVGIGLLLQGPVVDIPATAESPSQDLLLLSGRVEPIPVRSFLLHILHDIVYEVESQPCI